MLVQTAGYSWYKDVMKRRGFLSKYWMVILALIYVLSPIDLIPDVLPVFGIGDDAAVAIVSAILKYLQSRRDNEPGRVVEGEIVEK